MNSKIKLILAFITALIFLGLMWSALSIYKYLTPKRDAFFQSVEKSAQFYNEETLRDEALELLNECKKRAKEVYRISLKTFESLKEKENAIPIIIVVKYKELTLKDIDKNKHKLIIVNDRIELPGNLGTIYI